MVRDASTLGEAASVAAIPADNPARTITRVENQRVTVIAQLPDSKSPDARDPTLFSAAPSPARGGWSFGRFPLPVQPPVPPMVATLPPNSPMFLNTTLNSTE